MVFGIEVQEQACIVPAYRGEGDGCDLILIGCRSWSGHRWICLQLRQGAIGRYPCRAGARRLELTPNRDWRRKDRQYDKIDGAVGVVITRCDKAAVGNARFDNS